MSDVVRSQRIGQFRQNVSLHLLKFTLRFVCLISKSCNQQRDDRIVLQAFKPVALVAFLPYLDGFTQQFVCPLSCFKYRLFHSYILHHTSYIIHHTSYIFTSKH